MMSFRIPVFHLVKANPSVLQRPISHFSSVELTTIEGYLPHSWRDTFGNFGGNPSFSFTTLIHFPLFSASIIIVIR